MLAPIAWGWLAVLAPSPTSQPELTLQWDAPPTCPDEPRVRARVEALLGRPLGEAESTLTVIARIEKREAWHLQLTTRTADGSRTRPFVGQSCDVLAETAILAIAIAIDPAVTGRALTHPPVGETDALADADSVPPLYRAIEPASEPGSPPPAEAGLRPDASDAVDVSERSDLLPLRLSARVAAGATIGLLPAIGPSLTGAAAILVSWARIELRYDHHFERDHIDDRRSAAVRLWVLGLRGCGAPIVAKVVEFPLCIGVQAGPMRGRSLADLPTTGRTSLPFVAIDAGAAVAYFPVAWLGVGAGADLVVPITRPGFEVVPLGVGYRTGPAGGRFWAGLELRTRGLPAGSKGAAR